MIRYGTHVWIIALIVAVMLAFACAAQAEPATEAIPIYFFHETVCGSCDGTEEFYAVLDETLSDVKDAHPYMTNTYNTFQTTGDAVYGQMLAERGLDRKDCEPPVAIVGSKVLIGMESITRGLREAFLTAAELMDMTPEYRAFIEAPEAGNLFGGFAAGENESTILYFYRITCDECNQTKPVIEALPASVEIGGETSPVVVHSLNTRAGANIDRIKQLFALYQVPDDLQAVPIVFLADTYLSGYEAIAAQLPGLLAEGAALGFAFPETENAP